MTLKIYVKRMDSVDCMMEIIEFDVSPWIKLLKVWYNYGTIET